MGEFKLTLFIFGLLFAFFVYLYLSGSIKESEFNDLIPVLIIILIIAGPVSYLIGFGAYNTQFINAMSVYYSDIVE